MANTDLIWGEIETAFQKIFEIRKLCPLCKSLSPIFTMVCPKCAEPLKIAANGGKISELVEKIFNETLVIEKEISDQIKDCELLKYIQSDTINRIHHSLNSLFRSTARYYEQLSASSQSLKNLLRSSLAKIKKRAEQSPEILKENPFRIWLGEYAVKYDAMDSPSQMSVLWSKITHRPLPNSNTSSIKDCQKIIHDITTNISDCAALSSRLDQLAFEGLSILQKNSLQLHPNNEGLVVSLRRQLEIYSLQASISHIIDFIPEYVSHWRQNHA